MSIVTFYRGDPKNAPRPTQKAKLGSNVILTSNGKLLLERRSDNNTWGLVGGGVKKTETGRQAIVREVYEELGLHLKAEDFRKLAVYGDPGRIAAYRDGSIWRMVIVVYGIDLPQIPTMRISKESRELRFFTPEEISEISIAVTHEDIVQDWFVSGNYQLSNGDSIE